jgi:hypothetical protein
MTFKQKMSAFGDGWASVFDYCGAGRIPTPDLSKGLEQDYLAIAGDWQAVGNDMWGAFNAIAAEYPNAK